MVFSWHFKAKKKKKRLEQDDIEYEKNRAENYDMSGRIAEVVRGFRDWIWIPFERFDVSSFLKLLNKAESAIDLHW